MSIVTTGPVSPDSTPLAGRDVPVPEPAQDEVRLRVHVCGVCHTDLDEIEGRLPVPHLPRVPGHQIVGTIEACGTAVTSVARGARVGVAWISRTCGSCRFCQSGRENLCPSFMATGCDVDGGYAEFAVAPAASVYPIPDAFNDAEAAPLLCAGAIGLRSLKLAQIKDGDALGLTGFGASAHLVLQLAKRQLPRSPIFVFARDAGARRLALDLGAEWAGDTADAPPSPLAAIIDTTPVWRPVARALRHLDRGGRLVINAIRKDDRDKAELMSIDYARDLWLERSIVSVANVTRTDVREFLQAAAIAPPIRPKVRIMPLAKANEAIRALATGGSTGALVLDCRA